MLSAAGANRWDIFEEESHPKNLPFRIANSRPTAENPRRSKLVENDLFNIFNAPRGRLCGFSILALDRSQNPPVATFRRSDTVPELAAATRPVSVSRFNRWRSVRMSEACW